MPDAGLHGIDDDDGGAEVEKLVERAQELESRTAEWQTEKSSLTVERLPMLVKKMFRLCQSVDKCLQHKNCDRAAMLLKTVLEVGKDVKKAGTEAARKRNLWRKQLEVKCREMSAIKSEMVTIIYATKNAKNATASNVRCPTMPLQQQELKTRRKRKVALTEEPDPLSVLLSPFCMTPSAK